MKVQFICTGNTFRSRIAEAYLESKNIPNLIVSSSGINVQRNLNGSVSRHAVETLKKHHLYPYLANSWTVTDKDEIEIQDLVIFMEKIHYDFCLHTLHCQISNYEIWNIADLSTATTAEKIFQQIKQKIDALISKKLYLI